MSEWKNKKTINQAAQQRQTIKKFKNNLIKLKNLTFIINDCGICKWSMQDFSNVENQPYARDSPWACKSSLVRHQDLGLAPKNGHINNFCKIFINCIFRNVLAKLKEIFKRVLKVLKIIRNCRNFKKILGTLQNNWIFHDMIGKIFLNNF